MSTGDVDVTSIVHASVTIDDIVIADVLETAVLDVLLATVMSFPSGVAVQWTTIQSMRRFDFFSFSAVDATLGISNAKVLGPTTPSGVSLWSFWNCLTRSSVSGPNTPSGYKFSAFYMSLTVSPREPFLNMSILSY